MDDVVIMQVLHSIDDLRSVFLDIIFFFKYISTSLHELLETTTLQVRCDKEEAIISLKEVIDPQQCRMR